MTASRAQPEFSITHATEPRETVLAGFSAFGLAGLTAVDYLVDHLGLEPQGRIAAAGLPTVTPFEDGRPRHPTRLFSREDLDVTVLVGELFVSPHASAPPADAVLEWTEESAVSEAVVLSGVPIAHGPDEHRAFYVATDGYRERRLADAPIRSMGRGFPDGTNAAMVERGLDSTLDVCTFVTPVHAQAPDIEAAIRLVEAVETVYDLAIDASPLEPFASGVQQYYAELAERMEERETAPEDRMYM